MCDVPVQINNIVWDSEGMDAQADCGLPQSLEIHLSRIAIQTFTPEQLHERIDYRLHEEYGFKVISFEIKVEGVTHGNGVYNNRNAAANSSK